MMHLKSFYQIKGESNSKIKLDIGFSMKRDLMILAKKNIIGPLDAEVYL